MGSDASCDSCVPRVAAGFLLPEIAICRLYGHRPSVCTVCMYDFYYTYRICYSLRRLQGLATYSRVIRLPQPQPHAVFVRTKLLRVIDIHASSLIRSPSHKVLSITSRSAWRHRRCCRFLSFHYRFVIALGIHRLNSSRS